MKNEDLYVYKKSNFYEDYISSQKEYYEREQVDTLLAEKDREIALLKERICNGDVSRLTWIDDCIAKDKEIAELKQRIDKLVGVKKSAEKILQKLLDCGHIKEWYFNGKFNAVLSADDPHLQIAELKQKLEDVKATAYAESVDTGMRERRLKMALWLARAERAEAEHAHWATIWFCNTKISLNINKSSVSQDTYKSNTFRNASDWRNMWYDIASKCRKKAEEYK